MTKAAWVSLAAVVGLGVLGHAQLAAGTPWTLTTADFESRQVELVGLSEQGVVVAGQQGGQRETVPLGRFLELSRPPAKAVGAGVSAATTRPAAGFTLVLASGDRLGGTPGGIEGETLAWESPVVGRISVSLREVRAIMRPVAGAATGQPAEEAPTEDRLTLGNGDVVSGVVSGMAEGAIQVAQQGGGTTPVPLEAVQSIVFAAAPGGAGKQQGADARGRGFRVRLADGSSLVAPVVAVEGEQVRLTLRDGSKRDLPLSAVGGIEQVNGPVTFLSSLTPVEDEQRPYLGEPWPTRMDRSVTGDPLRVAGQEFARGIGVHAYSRLVFELGDGSYERFRTQYAIDGQGAYANVTVRIRVDDRVVHEQADVTAGKAWPVVEVPVKGAKRLTLEVDYGAANDTQDRFAWVNPALLR